MDNESSAPNNSYQKYASLHSEVAMHAGFPNPGSDERLQLLDFNQLLIVNRASTFMFRVCGSNWRDVGIFDGDIAVIDRALAARSSDMVIWWKDDNFAISLLAAAHKDAVIFGVVTNVVHELRKADHRGK